MKLGNIIGIVVAACLVGAILWRIDINGWGSLLWLLAMGIMSAIRIPEERAAQSVATRKSEQSSLENILLAGMLVGSGIVPAIHLVTGVFAFANFSLPDWMLVPGVVMTGIGLWVFWRSHADLGKNWSVSLEIREQHGLITNGIYERIRHPMYAGMFLIYTGFPFFLQNWIAGFSGLAAFCALYLARVSKEEAMMRDEFGESYDEYCRRSGRLMPKLAKSR